MKTANPGTGEELKRRSRFDYAPDRHYVLVQRPDANWDGPQLDRLLDEVDDNGEDAYRIEADGEKGALDRRVTGHRQMVMLSCSKDHADVKTAEASQASNASTYSIKQTPDMDEKLEFRSAISIDEIAAVASATARP